MRLLIEYFEKHKFLLAVPSVVLLFFILSFYTNRFSFLGSLLSIFRSTVQSSSLMPIISPVSYGAGVFSPNGNFMHLPSGGKLLLFLKNNNLYAMIYQNNNWDSYSTPLVTSEVRAVSSFLEGNKLHLALQSMGKIIYKNVEINIVNGNVVFEGWIFGPEVVLDNSTLANRPSIAVANGLPIVAWSFETKRLFPLATKIRLMAAKSNPTDIKNWCNLALNSCGLTATGFFNGSSEEIYLTSRRIRAMPLLIKYSDNKIGFWYFDKDGRWLKRSFLSKSGNGWVRSETVNEIGVGGSTLGNYDISFVYDSQRNSAVLLFKNSDDKITVRTVSEEGLSNEIPLDGDRVGSGLSLTTIDGKIYVFYGRDGNLIYKSYDGNAWTSEKILLSDLNGLMYILAEDSSPSFASLGVAFVFNDESGKQAISALTSLNGNVSVTPTSLPTPTYEITPSPTEAVATPSATPTVPPLVSPTLTETPTASPSVIIEAVTPTGGL